MTLVDKRYAECLLDVAIAKNRTRSYVQMLTEARRIFLNSKELQAVVKNPRVPKQVKKDILFSIFQELLSDTLVRWLFVLVDNNRIQRFPTIVENFRIVANNAEHILKIEILTPYKLADDQIDIICDKFKKKENASSIRYEQIIDKSLIGGFVVRIGDKLYDYSVQNKLRQLTKNLG